MGGLAWAALFVNNTNFLDLSVGYDAKDHLAYVQFLMSHARLPLPSDGWEMNQPPLYYMIVAAAHQLLSLDIGSFSSVAAFRCIGLLAGLAQLFFVGQSLQLIFPRHPRRCLVGMLVAICIPANLYLYQYPTNELLLATLASASVFCALRLLCLHRVNMATFIALGLCLGGALLVKVSGIVVCTAVMLTLIARCVLRGHRRCSMGIMMVASCAILISGWYYYHTWQLTGSLWVGNQDPRSGFAWWQDPGYISATYYLHFGHVFVEPFYSGVVSLWDGLFATLWGDGLVGGRKNLRVGPPWNYSWMTLGYLLAVGPTLMGFAGLVLAVRRFIRRPSWAWCLLLLLSAMMFMIIVAYNLLQQSYYHSAKAFYGLSALIPLCACIGWGADELISRLRLLKIPVVILLLSWAMVSYASFWIRPSTAPTQIHLAMQQVQKHNLQNAQDHLARALEHDPDNLHAMMARITLLINTRPPDTRKVLKLTEQMLQASPNHAEAYWLAAQIYSVAGMRDDAIVYAQRAAELAPEFKEIHLFLAQTYALAGSLDKAAASCHLALKSSPADGPAHQLLGKIYRAMGDTQAADKHAGYLAAIRKAREFLPAMR
jgi:tetratricopeptide (TPR) repeat protein